MAIDSLGGDVLTKTIDGVRPMGVVVAFGFVAGTMVTFEIRNFFFGQKQLRGSTASEIENLEWGLEQIEAGLIKPLLARTLPHGLMSPGGRSRDPQKKGAGRRTVAKISAR